MKIVSTHLSSQFLVLLLTLAILSGVSASETCQLTFKDKHKVYFYSLASPVRSFRHGLLSEDGFYKVAANGSVLWFQFCASMIFNHDPPLCVDCKDCGGPSRCGMGCSALVSQRIGGYPVCTSLGHPSSTQIYVLDKKSPHMGIIVRMSSYGSKHNCSLSVSVICNSLVVQGPQTLETANFCDYKTELKHPLGCAKVISSGGGGLGWFGTLLIIILCIFGVYIVAGAAYRLYQTWSFGHPYHIEYRALISLSSGDSGGLHMVTGVRILQLIFSIACCIIGFCILQTSTSSIFCPKKVIYLHLVYMLLASTQFG